MSLPTDHPVICPLCGEPCDWERPADWGATGEDHHWRGGWWCPECDWHAEMPAGWDGPDPDYERDTAMGN